MRGPLPSAGRESWRPRPLSLSLDSPRRCGNRCTLIITEGDSAKALAVAGLSIVGRATACKGCARHPHTGCRTVDRRDHYGVFPLRGKLLNVRDAAHSTIMVSGEAPGGAGGGGAQCP